jgi:predicted molibdopterin-dependent oxidoreductase YjgC
LPISPYAYVGNNPIVRIDPDGRDWYEDKEGNLHWHRDLTKDNYEDFFEEHNIEGSYLGEIGFSINEEGLSVIHNADGNETAGLWQLNEVVVEAEMTDHQRIMNNPVVQAMHEGHGQFIGITGQLVETSGNTITQASILSGFAPGVAIGYGISTVGSLLTATNEYSKGNTAAGNYLLISTGIGRATGGLINRLVPQGGRDLLITQGWLEGFRTVTDKTVGRKIKEVK